MRLSAVQRPSDLGGVMISGYPAVISGTVQIIQRCVYGGRQ
jgi:hypothetical protein